jgi:hypothetical protein
MAKIDFDLDDLTNAALRRMVKKLLIASDSEEKEILSSLDKKSKAPPKNDLADLDEQMHGKPNTPMVEEDDLPSDGELADLPKKGKK